MNFGVMFHHFTNAKHIRVQGAINSFELKFILLNLQKRYRVLNAHDYFDKFLSSTLQPGEICLTFDDGLLCQWDVAVPVLQEFNLTAFWFIYSSVFEGNIENLEVYRFFRNSFFDSVDSFYLFFFEYLKHKQYLNRNESQQINEFSPDQYLKEFSFYTDLDRKFRFVRDQLLKREKYEKLMDEIILSFNVTKEFLAKNLWMNNEHLKDLHKCGHIIGAHSYSHPTLLQELPPTHQFEEYQKNFSHIKTITGENPQCLAHPCNSYNSTTLEILRGEGIKLGFRSNMIKNSFSSLEYPREDHINLLKEFKSTSKKEIGIY